MHILKWFSILILALFITLTATIGYVLLVLDPNDFKKPAIDWFHQNYDLSLEIQNFNWQFFPNIGITTDQLEIKTLKGERLASIESAKFAVSTLPLLQQSIQISQVTIIKPTITYHSDANGNSEWGKLLTPTPTTSTNDKPSLSTDPTQQALPFKITAQQLTLKDGTLTYKDAQKNINYEIKDLFFQADNVALNHAFPIKLKAKVFDSKSLALSINSTSKLMLKLEQNQYQLNPLNLTLSLLNVPGLNKPQTANIQLNTELDLNKETLSIPKMQLTLAGINTDLSLKATQILSKPSFKAQISSSTSNLQHTLYDLAGLKLPKLNDPQILKQLQITTKAQGNTQQLTLEGLNLIIDDSHLQGSVKVMLADTTLTGSLSLNTIDLDRYLPENEENRTPSKTVEQTMPQQPIANTTLIPAQALHDLNANLSIQADKIIYQSIPMHNIALTMTADQGLIQLKSLQLKTLEGNIQGQGYLDVRKQIPRLEFSSRAENLQLHPLLLGLLQQDIATGTLSFSTQFTTEGNSFDHWIKSLIGQSQLDLNNGTLKGTNLTQIAHQSFTQFNPLINALLPKDYKEKVPPAFQKDTEIRSLLAKLKIENGQITTEQLTADLGKAKSNGKAKLDLATQTLDLNLNLKLDESISNPTIAQLSWPIGCKLNTESLFSCKLNSQPVKKQLEKMLESKTKKKLEAKLQEKLKNELGLKPKQNDTKQTIKDQEDQIKNSIEQKLKHKFEDFF